MGRTAQSELPVVVGFAHLLSRSERAQAELHRLLFEKVPHPRFVCAEGTLAIQEVNAAAVRKFGYSRAEFSQMKLTELCATVEAPRLEAFCRQRGGRREPAPVFRFRKRNGAWLEIELDSGLIPLRGRRMILILAQDVTEKRRVHRRLRAQQIVHRALVESSTVAEASPQIFKALCENFGCDWGELWRVDPSMNALRCTEIWHPNEQPLPEMARAARHGLFSHGVGIPGTVWARNKPLWVTDVLQQPSFQRAAVTARQGLRSVFAFPIRLNTEVLGVISIYRREPMPPDKHLLGLLEDISVQIGQVMGRRRAERRLLEISEREQQRIGQDLHDGLCQQLAGLSYLASDLEGRLAKQSRPEAARAARIAELARETATQARQVAGGLNPVKLGRTGLLAALGELASSISSMFSIACRFECARRVPMPDHETAVHLYRIAQEAIHNAITHGKAREIVVTLDRAAGALVLRITDNGRGFSGASPASNGTGCENMRYRARAIGGRLEIARRPGGGCVVTCTLSGREEKHL